MIRVTPAPEPADFDVKVRQPGLRAVREMCGQPVAKRPGRPRKVVAKRPEDIPPDSFPPYWQDALDNLKNAYEHICAYSCFRIHPVTGAASVDHMAPKSRRHDAVYEWSNYRLACSRLNARKRDFQGLLDPFEIEDGWFQLELLGFSVFPNPELSPRLRERVDSTITELGLNDFRSDREKDAHSYWDGHVSLAHLREQSPFVAAELKRQKWLRPGDA